MLRSPIGTGGRGYVTRDDCARTDAGALADDFDGRRIVDVTGPAVVTHAELAEIASRVTGRPVRYEPATRAAAAAAWTDLGVPREIAVLCADFDMDASQGHHAVVTDAVEALGGATPTSVERVLSANAALLAPDADNRTQMAALIAL